MKHSLPIAPQFYVTAPQPCPYLENKVERKLFTGLQDGNGKALNNSLSKQGFRRSQNVLYRPACESCSACISARIRVKDFKLSKSQKRIIRRNKGMERSSHTAWATEEQFDLFKSYLSERHEDGGMADMDMFEFAAMVEETPVRTVVVEYHKENESRRKPLMAACLTDVLEDGLSMVYSFFDTDLQNKSVGKYMILDHVEIAKEAGLDYIYLGYWVPGSPKMAYKSEFDALELFIDGEWQKIKDANSIDTSHIERGHKSILEQVASISLPEVIHKED